MNFSTYSSCLTAKKTMLVVSAGICGEKNYRELQVLLKHGMFNAVVTDGYYKIDYKRFNSLKEAIQWFQSEKIAA